MDGDLRGEGLVVSEVLKEDLNKLALASRILEMEGHGDFTLGHLGMRDPEGRGVWIKRWGLTLGEVYDWTDHQLIDLLLFKNRSTCYFLCYGSIDISNCLIYCFTHIGRTSISKLNRFIFSCRSS